MTQLQTLEVPIAGMDCTECTQHVQRAIAQLPGVESVDVFLASEKATIRLDPSRLGLPAIRQAVSEAGYSIPGKPFSVSSSAEEAAFTSGRDNVSRLKVGNFSRRVTTLLAFLFGALILIVVGGEWLGLFELLTSQIPFVIGIGIVAVVGWPIFSNVIRAALRRQITSHTLMTLGVIAALVIGEWVTAAVVAFFMRVGDYTEKFTTEGARRAVRDLSALAPQTARIERNGVEVEIPVTAVTVGQTVIVRPGEVIPVDGDVINGQATIDQSAITGEALPIEVGPGAHVFAATITRLGSLRVRAARVGADTTFGRVVKLVEEAEAHRADVQRFADKFTNYYLPVVAAIALLTFVLRRDASATAAVLVVACSCSIALATPIAMLASVGAGAKRGLLIKGGKYLEALTSADVVLLDKTGTLTLGQPQLTDVVALDGLTAPELLTLAASAERYSEHPLAEAVRAAARASNLTLLEPQGFEAVAGLGVKAVVNGDEIRVGNRRFVANDGGLSSRATELEAAGKALLFVSRNEETIGVLAAADTLRSEVPAALNALRAAGVRRIELLTGDNARAAAALAHPLGISYRADLLPEDKIRIVKEYQSKGHIVVMVGDGVNDAPALAQANVGIAMGAAGTDIAIEAAHIALMRDDWALVPEVFAIARRTMNVVKSNLAFTAVYNIAGLSLAALGYLPPIFAAAAQSLPDLGILANSARLLRQR